MKTLFRALSAMALTACFVGASAPATANEEHGKPAHKPAEKHAPKAKACKDCKTAKHKHAEACCGKHQKPAKAHSAHGEHKH